MAQMVDNNRAVPQPTLISRWNTRHEWQEAELVEVVARAITGVRWDRVEKPNGNTQCRDEYIHYIWTNWLPEAKAAITAIKQHMGK